MNFTWRRRTSGAFLKIRKGRRGDNKKKKQHTIKENNDKLRMIESREYISGEATTIVLKNEMQERSETDEERRREEENKKRIRGE